MIANSRPVILQAFAELSRLYPMMRLGQIVVFVSTITGKTLPGEAETAEDEAVITAARQHAEHRASQLGLEINRNRTSLPPTRADLLKALEELGNREPDCRFGQMIVLLANKAGVNIYDVEDEQLLEAVNELLARTEERA